MGDFWSWYSELWQGAWHNFAGLVVLLVAHFLALALVAGALGALFRGVGAAASAFADGWRKGGGD